MGCSLASLGPFSRNILFLDFSHRAPIFSLFFPVWQCRKLSVLNYSCELYCNNIFSNINKDFSLEFFPRK
jgi:hypothetical protein